MAEDESLKAALELHAAINGLRRGRREPSHSAGHERALEVVRAKAASKAAQQQQKEQQQREQQEQGSHEEASHSGQARKREAEGEEATPSRASSVDKREAKRAKTESHETAPKLPTGYPVGSLLKPELQQQQQQQQQLQQQQQQPKRKPSEGRKQRQKQDGAQKDGAEKGAAQPAQQQQQASTPLTPLEEAAHAAGAAAQARAKQQQGSDAARRIKCFMAGIRWGINLAPDSLSTRSDLATALNDALAGEILSCGRGDMLSVTMLDQEGNTSVFPPLKSGVCESSNQWKACVANTSRIYVMRGS